MRFDGLLNGEWGSEGKWEERDMMGVGLNVVVVVVLVNLGGGVGGIEYLGRIMLDR